MKNEMTLPQDKTAKTHFWVAIMANTLKCNMKLEWVLAVVLAFGRKKKGVLAKRDQTV
jgi:hypothetical protein